MLKEYIFCTMKLITYILPFTIASFSTTEELQSLKSRFWKYIFRAHNNKIFYEAGDPKERQTSIQILKVLQKARDCAKEQRPI